MAFHCLIVSAWDIRRALADQLHAVNDIEWPVRVMRNDFTMIGVVVMIGGHSKTRIKPEVLSGCYWITRPGTGVPSGSVQVDSRKVRHRRGDDKNRCGALTDTKVLHRP